MAANSKTTASTTSNGAPSPSLSGKPLELSLTLPSSPGTKIHIHLTILAATTLIFLTSGSLETSNSASMGSFVMGVPDRYNPAQPLSTALYTLPGSLDFATRMARLLARRTGLPCYVGSSVDLGAAAGGGSVEEEMAVFRAVVEAVMAEVGKVRGGGT